VSTDFENFLCAAIYCTSLSHPAVVSRIIEGIAEVSVAIAQVFSCVASDYFRKRKFLVVLGYALAAINKPVFPLATTIEWVFRVESKV